MARNFLACTRSGTFRRSACKLYRRKLLSWGELFLSLRKEDYSLLGFRTYVRSARVGRPYVVRVRVRNKKKYRLVFWSDRRFARPVHVRIFIIAPEDFYPNLNSPRCVYLKAPTQLNLSRRAGLGNQRFSRTRPDFVQRPSTVDKYFVKNK